MGIDDKHRPLPYVVVVRSFASEDASAPVVSEYRVVAYSIIEAMIQAMTEAGGQGGLDDTKYKIERISPDVDAWVRMMAEKKP